MYPVSPEASGRSQTELSETLAATLNSIMTKSCNTVFASGEDGIVYIHACLSDIMKLQIIAHQLRSPKCCSCTNIKSRMAADCFAAAGRLQYTSFQTNSVDLNDALLLSFHDWMDAGSRELYIYDQVHMNGPPDMGQHFWGHLPLSWMREHTVNFTLYYILFYNEGTRDGDSPLWVLVLKDTRRQRPHRWT